MKYKNLIIVFAVLILLFGISGCGSPKLESGDMITDSSVLSEGCFDSKIIDTSAAEGILEFENSFCNDSFYSYIISSRNESDYIEREFFFSFDSDGKKIYSGELDYPIYPNGGKLVYADVCSGLDIMPYDLTVSGGEIKFFNFSFDSSGAFSARMAITAFFADGNTPGEVYRQFIVNWNKDGKCISIESVIDTSFDTVYPSIVNNLDTEHDYKFTLSGISQFDNNGTYVSEYFDYLNSGLDFVNFSAVCIKDQDSFSGLYFEDGNARIAIFNRNFEGIYNDKPILIACTDMDDSLREDVIRFNAENKGYRIAVYDYSDRVSSDTAEEAWSLLKSDLKNGFYPDIILNTSGYDSAFISWMANEGRICDLQKVITEDKELSGISFDQKAKDLFYSSDKLYCFVPSYSYRTVVANSDLMNTYAGWGIDGFKGFTDPIKSSSVLFSLDTRDDFIHRVLEYNGNYYVDYVTHESRFDSDEFITFLEYASSLPADDNAAWEFSQSLPNESKNILKDYSCDHLGNMFIDATIAVKGSYSDLGFPHGLAEGNGVISVNRAYMISADSSYANTCWQFIKQYIKDDYQTSGNIGIPVTASGYEAWVSSTAATYEDPGRYVYTIDDNYFMVGNPIPEDVKAITDHIAACTQMEFSDYKIEQIVLEYARKYFDGQMTAQEAASAIDNEVESYLAS